MPTRPRLLYSLLTATLLLIPGLALFRELTRRSDIWWTPWPMASSLAQSQDRVEIRVRDQPLGALLNTRQLWMKVDTGFSAVVADDIRLRFNNWDHVRAVRIPLVMVCAAALGAWATLLLLIATARLRYRNDNRSVAA